MARSGGRMSYWNASIKKRTRLCFHCSLLLFLSFFFFGNFQLFKLFLNCVWNLTGEVFPLSESWTWHEVTRYLYRLGFSLLMWYSAVSLCCLSTQDVASWHRELYFGVAVWKGTCHPLLLLFQQMFKYIKNYINGNWSMDSHKYLPNYVLGYHT